MPLVHGRESFGIETSFSLWNRDKYALCNGCARWTWALILSVAAMPVFAQQAATTTGPVGTARRQSENPLGIDDPAPKFSWQLRDPAPGAKQTAYEVLGCIVAGLLAAGKSRCVGQRPRRIRRNRSNVRYGGPALKPSTRYFWRVKLWGANGKAYAASADGLVGNRPDESGCVEGAVDRLRDAGRGRGAPRAGSSGSPIPTRSRRRSRKTPSSASPTARRHAAAAGAFAALYATGQDTVAAWVNGAQVLTEDPLPPWKQMPWKKFVRADVTAKSERRRKHASPSNRCITWSIPTAWRRTMRRR